VLGCIEIPLIMNDGNLLLLTLDSTRLLARAALRRAMAALSMTDTRMLGPQWVESECGAVAVGRTYLLPPLSSGGASLVPPWLRFHTPLIEPNVQISRIRLSDKTSRLFACNAVCGV
jgi:hypothetical protein